MNAHGDGPENGVANVLTLERRDQSPDDLEIHIRSYSARTWPSAPRVKDEVITGPARMPPRLVLHFRRVLVSAHDGDELRGRVKAILFVLVIALAAVGTTTPAAQRRAAPVLGFKVVATFPHDPNAFTQGLVYADGELYESTGLHGESTVRRVELATGLVLQRRAVGAQYFAEGLALVGDELLQLTWQHQLGFVYDRRTFAPRRTFTYATEGWGLAYDAKGGLVMSDGTDRLFFLDPKTQKVKRTVQVTDGGRPVGQLNELEWIEGKIWANVWTTDRIARIASSTGVVTSWVDLSSLWPAAQRTPGADVFNGIAYDAAGKRIFVTGKKWPRIYQISVQ